jgi:hypothetical protein
MVKPCCPIENFIAEERAAAQRSKQHQYCKRNCATHTPILLRAAMPARLSDGRNWIVFHLSEKSRALAFFAFLAFMLVVDFVWIGPAVFSWYWFFVCLAVIAATIAAKTAFDYYRPEK